MRIAVDTNLLVRLFAKDHRDQWLVVKRVFEGERLLITNSVWMECEWVLRSIFGYPRVRVVELMKGLVGLANVECEEGGDIVRALRLFERGLDFADAIHACTARNCESILTFDRKFIRQAAALGVEPVVRIP